MSRVIFGALAVATLTMSGCYVDDLQDRAQTPPNAAEPTRVTGRNGSECRSTLSRGCFDGHVLSETPFQVEGEEFFNADDLANPNRFLRLLKIQRDGQALTAGKDFTVQMVTRLDRESFAQNFEYVLDGDYFRRGQVRADGNFSINDLAEGTYDLRIQKGIKFVVVEVAKVVETVPAPEATTGTTEGETPAPAAEPTVTKKQFCATIYADTQIEVRRGHSTFEKFDNYKMYVTDNECADSGEGTSLTL